MAFHCSACNRCIVDFDNHSILVNNCISGNNQQYLIMFLLALLGFFVTLIMISILHFEKPSRAFENAFSDIVETNLDAISKDLDGPY